MGNPGSGMVLGLKGENSRLQSQ